MNLFILMWQSILLRFNLLTKYPNIFIYTLSTTKPFPFIPGRLLCKHEIEKIHFSLGSKVCFLLVRGYTCLTFPDSKYLTHLFLFFNLYSIFSKRNANFSFYFLPGKFDTYFLSKVKFQRTSSSFDILLWKDFSRYLNLD